MILIGGYIEQAGRCIQHHSGSNQNEPVLEVPMADSCICSVCGCDKPVITQQHLWAVAVLLRELQLAGDEA